MGHTALVILSVLYVARSQGTVYKPVVLIHGILDSGTSMTELAECIQKYHPGTNVTMLDNLHHIRSLAPMWIQVRHFGKSLQSIMSEHPEGIHLLGYSQGGLIARGIVESFPHNVHTFLSLSSPQGGQFGDAFLHLYYPNFIREEAYRYFYTIWGQLTSVGNYWRDPHQQKLFYAYSAYLPFINNEIKTNHSSTYKANFLKLKKLVLIGGPDDGVITPWQSSSFGIYDDNETVINLRNTMTYRKDLFGLKTMDKEKRVDKYAIPGVDHLEWHRREDICVKYILPYLD